METNFTTSNITLLIVPPLSPYLLSSLYLLAVRICAYRVVSLAVILFKFVNNISIFRECTKIPIFSAYFGLLIVSNIFLISADLVLAINVHQGIYNLDVKNLTNFLAIMGILCLDTFLGLIPNVFYSVFKTHMAEKSDKMTKKYFLINLFVLGGFFLVVMIMNFVASMKYAYTTNIVIILELVYTTAFYLLTLRAMGKLENLKIQRVILRYFLYFIVYAIVQTIRCSGIAYNLATNNPVGDLNVLLTDFSNVAELVIMILYMRDLKFSVREHKSKASSSGSKKTRSWGFYWFTGGVEAIKT